MTSQDTGIYCEEPDTLPIEEDDSVIYVRDEAAPFEARAASLLAQAQALAALSVEEVEASAGDPETHARYLGRLAVDDEEEGTLPVDADDSLEEVEEGTLPAEAEGEAAEAEGEAAEPAQRIDTGKLLADFESTLAGAKQVIAKADDLLEQHEETTDEGAEDSSFDEERFNRVMSAAAKLPDHKRKASPPLSERKPKAPKAPKAALPKPSPASPKKAVPKPSPAKASPAKASLESLKSSCNNLRQSIKSKKSAFHKNDDEDNYEMYRTWKEMCCTRAKEYEGDSLLRFLHFVKDNLQQVHHRLSKGMSGTVRFEEPPCFRDDA
jgi:hypothetical protein